MLRLRQDFLRFPEGKSKAFTLSYDDGVTQDERLISILDRLGLRCTFNLNSGLFGHRDWLEQPGIDVSHYKWGAGDIARIYGSHEVAVHTLTHPDLTRIPDSAVVFEVSENKRDLEAIVRRPVRGMAYPFGTWNEHLTDILAACGIIYSRTVDSTHDFRLPDDFLAWHPTAHHTEPELMELAERFISEEPDKDPALFYVWGHSYEFDAFDQWDYFESFLEKAAGIPDVWYASNSEICEYVLASKQLVYSSSGDYIFNPTSYDIWLSVDSEILFIPSGETVTVPYERKIIYPERES